MVGELKGEELFKPLIEVIRTRRSVRRFLNKPVEWDKIGCICEAGKAAPSSGNIQNWKFIIVDDKEKKKQIAEACMQQQWMMQAPYHIVVVGNPEQGKQFYGVRGERLYTIQNCAAVTMNMLLAAHALGLGACWVGAFEEDMVKRILGVQEYARPQAIIPIGYPAESPPDPVEYTIENLMYLNKWKTGCTIVKEPDIVCAYYSKIVEQRIDEAKDLIQNAFGKGKEAVHKLSEKASQKAQEQKEPKKKEEKKIDLDSERTSWIMK